MKRKMISICLMNRDAVQSKTYAMPHLFITQKIFMTKKREQLFLRQNFFTSKNFIAVKKCVFWRKKNYWRIIFFCRKKKFGVKNLPHPTKRLTEIFYGICSVIQIDVKLFFFIFQFSFFFNFFFCNYDFSTFLHFFKVSFF